MGRLVRFASGRYSGTIQAPARSHGGIAWVKSRETAVVEPQDKAEAAWRAEFKRIGEAQLRDALNSSMLNDESKRQAALRWLGDETQALRLHEDQTSHYVRWTFLVAVAVVIVGVIGVGLTLLH